MADPHRRRGGLTSDLADRIARAKQDASRPDGPDAPIAARDMTGLSRALRLGSEFIAAILVGAAIGFFLDQWLGTGPWIMLVMLMVGFAAGIVNVTRTVAAMNKAAPPATGAQRVPDDDEDDA
jgi:ATP synthase protein I